MTNATTLAALSTSALVTLFNSAVVDYAPQGFEEVKRFKSKAEGVSQVEALCAAGNLAVSFDGGAATIIDAMVETEGDEANDDEAGDEAGEVAFGDGKGKARDWGFVLSSDEWLKAHPRGTAERDTYRKERRKAARMARKALRAAKDAAHADAE